MALNFLSRRQMTVWQLEKKLQEKGFSQEDIRETVNKLIQWKYLDDENYALSYIKSKRDKISKKKMVFGLRQAGIDQELTHKLLDETYGEDKEHQNCFRQALKLWEAERMKWEKRYKDSPRYQNIPQNIFIQKRVGDKLLMRGFPLSIVKSVLADVFAEKTFKW